MNRRHNENGADRHRRSSPWSQPPGGHYGGGGGPQPPNFEEFIEKLQKWLRNLFPNGGLSASGIALVLPVVFVIWLATGIFFVQPGQLGVTLRFGEYQRQALPGANYHLPYPIETVEIVDIQRIRKASVGYDDRPGLTAVNIPAESLMLTGDENIVDIDFDVFWRVNDAPKFLFNVEAPEGAVKAVAESSMREVVGENQLQAILTERRGAIEVEVQELMQEALDSYGSGILITEVKMQKSDPPAAVISAYRDVQAAKADKERLVNEANAYANRVIPEARGKAARIVEAAQAYRKRVTVEAEGQADRFISIYGAYRLAPELTRERMYLETLEKVFQNMNKIVIDQDGEGGNVVPYLPLAELQRSQTRNQDTDNRQ